MHTDQLLQDIDQLAAQHPAHFTRNIFEEETIEDSKPKACRCGFFAGIGFSAGLGAYFFQDEIRIVGDLPPNLLTNREAMVFQEIILGDLLPRIIRDPIEIRETAPFGNPWTIEYYPPNHKLEASPFFHFH